ncbi:ribonuclease P protein component [Tepidamorphus sp. 3E244]|uniref:ribonuclease P protein component n=1 Tax=Tepidamorphus sp. 3E244 TaxID=3385498 RepID=UPI0038FC1DE8
MNAEVDQPAAHETLRRRADFLKAQSGRKAVRPGFVLRAQQRAEREDLPARAGLTVSRKNGGAVQRNRIKRRLRAALRTIDPTAMRPGHDYVVIARSGALALPFATLARDLETAILGLHRDRQSAPAVHPKSSR